MRTSAVSYVLLMSVVPMVGFGAESEAPAPRTATKDEYFACLDASDSIEARKTKLAERDRRHKELAAKFQAAEADLAAQVKKHAPSTKAEIESYNGAVARRNASAERFNAESRSIQLEQRALNDLIVATNTSCGGLLISEEVAQAAEQRKQRTLPAR